MMVMSISPTVAADEGASALIDFRCRIKHVWMALGRSPWHRQGGHAGLSAQPGETGETRKAPGGLSTVTDPCHNGSRATRTPQRVFHEKNDTERADRHRIVRSRICRAC